MRLSESTLTVASGSGSGLRTFSRVFDGMRTMPKATWWNSPRQEVRSQKSEVRSCRLRRRPSGLWMVINRPACDEDFTVGRSPLEPRTTRQLRLGRSGSTELAEVLALS